MPNGRQQAMHEIALITAATGANFSPCFKLLGALEGANEAARRAVNGILDIEESDAPRCEIWNLHEPDILMLTRSQDQKRYDKGLPYKYYEPFLVKEAISFVDWIKKMWKKIFK